VTALSIKFKEDHMQLIGATLLMVIICCIIAATALAAFFIWIGSKFAGIPNATFGKAFLSALLSSIAVWVLTGSATLYFGYESFTMWLLGLAITLGILKTVYSTGWGKAFLIWIFTGIAHVIVGAILVILLITGALVLVL
jgi:hypothetical protein